ncbi:GNAT family N-acetyltransferase [Cellulosilyticum sp. I15G10I2]|uniref:GNAT family N-acetyltransferase n=1 Tax=Cellulosilyticum sp. I15G10I2 TaxID=1892843 RepID=UPI00085CE03E|nr:GNAT family N-acetyltransferase [Cellulosilyticum sp. I15G10I2]
MIKIRHADITEKYKTYEWLCLSDTAQMHMGEPDYPNNPIPSWEEFKEGFENFYYQEETRGKGSVMIIQDDGKDIGCLCYACFHLKPQKAELDIWLKGKEYCGNGNGTKALKALCDYLESSYNIKDYIIRPSIKNYRAVRAYEKVGFKKVQENEKEKTINEFLLPEFLNEYGDGDYGFEDTAVLIKTNLNAL